MTKIGKRKSKPLGPVGVTMPMVIKRERGLQKAVTMSPAEAMLAEAEEQPETVNAMEEGCQTGFTRRTLIVRKDHLDKLAAAAYWDRMTQVDVLDEILGAYFKGKRIKPKPPK